MPRRLLAACGCTRPIGACSLAAPLPGEMLTAVLNPLQAAELVLPLLSPRGPVAADAPLGAAAPAVSDQLTFDCTAPCILPAQSEASTLVPYCAPLSSFRVEGLI